MHNQLRLKKCTITVYTKPRRFIPAQLNIYLLGITCNFDELDTTNFYRMNDAE
jgi:hypothetical protein